MTDSFDPYYKWLGIPPAEQPPHHYRLLSIKVFEKDPDVIANAADRQMSHLRTFQAGKYTDLSQRLLNEVSTARLCLLTADKKAAYDEQLRARLKPKATKPKAEPPPVRAAAELPRAQSLVEADPFPIDFELEDPSPSAVRRGGNKAEGVKKSPTPVAPGRARPSKNKKSSSPVMLLVGLGAVAAVGVVIGLILLLRSGDDQPVAKKDDAKKASTTKDPAPLAVTQFDKTKKPPANDLPNTGAKTLPTPTPESNEPDSEPDDDFRATRDARPRPIDELTKPVNLLKRINRHRDAILGDWTRARQDLIAPPVKCARLQVPFAPPAEYLLTFEATWKPGMTNLIIGLPLESTQVALGIDHYPSSNISGLDLVDGKSFDQNETKHVENFIEPGRRIAIACAVRQNSIQATCDGKKVVDWSGDPRRLSVAAQWKVPDNRCIFLGGWDSNFRIHKLEVAPLPADFNLFTDGGTVTAGSGGGVDLLANIDTRRDAVKGEWAKQGGALIMPSAQGAKLELRADVPSEYRLSLDVERLAGKDALVVGLVMGQSRTALAIDGWGGTAHSLTLKGKDNPNESTRPGRALTERTNRLICTVRSGSVDVTCNGKPVYDWKGDPAVLDPGVAWGTPDPRRLFVGGYESSFKITRIELEDLNESAPPAAITLQPGKVSVDLLSLIELPRDAVYGTWRREGSGLIVPEIDFARLQIPHPVPQQYELTAVVERLTGKEALGIGLVVGGHRAVVVVDGDKGACSGLELIDGARFTDNATTYRQPLLMGNGAHTIVCTVWKRRVKTTCDGELVFDWSGDPNRLAVFPGFEVRDTTKLSIGGFQASFRILKLELRSLSAVAPLVEARPSTTGPSTTGPSTPTTSNGREVPETTLCEAALKSLRDKFADQYKNAKPEGKISLAQKLYQQGLATRDDAAMRYVMLGEARDLAASVGELKLTLEACDALGDSFAVDPWQLRAHAVIQAAAGARSNLQRREIVPLLLTLLDEAIAADQYVVAQELATAAIAAAGRGDDADMKKLTRGQKDRITRLQKAWDDLAPMVTALAADESDAAANLAVGKYRCFQLEDWSRGLPLLAKGSDPDLRSLAEAELRKPADADEQLRLGDGWWEVGERQSMPAKLLVEEHAASWYALALSNLAAGAARSRIETRVAKLDTLRASAGPVYNKPLHPADAVEFGRHWYKVIEVRTTWNQARQECEKLGGYLACIETADENAFLKALLVSDESGGVNRVPCWLGASDNDQEGVFRWVNGKISPFTDWKRGEPNNTNNESCVGFIKNNFLAPVSVQNLRWNDYRSNERFAYICEWER